MHDKGYYHSCLEGVLMPNYPTLIPKTTTPTPETLPGGGIHLPALFSPDSATAQFSDHSVTSSTRARGCRAPLLERGPAEKH